jgi:tRNA pseudouridine38-40 synthase
MKRASLPGGLTMDVEQLWPDDRPTVGIQRRASTGRVSSATTPPGQLRVRLLFAYNGAPFHGIAPQTNGVATIGNALIDALRIVLRQPEAPFLNMAGRTDAGVHAHGQVVHVDITPSPRGYDWDKVRRSLNQMLAPHVVVRVVEPAPTDFDARRSALWRRYRYTILNTPFPDPLSAQTVWHVSQPLDLDAMILATDPFLGEHDFTSFCRKPHGIVDPSLRRAVLDANWTVLPAGALRFEIRATSFCQQMVRAIVGFLVDVGHGRRHAGDVLAAIRAKDRRHASSIAPPTGLVLWKVGYADRFRFDEADSAPSPSPSA